jgi:membrane protease YdiL (CAAX protease family)
MVSKTSHRNDLTLFFLITFAWSWLINAPRLMATAGWFSLPDWLSPILGYAAVFGPMVAAFLMTGLRSGKEGKRELWQRGWKVNFPKIWFLPALFLVPVCGFITVGLLTLLGKPIAWEMGQPLAMLVPVALLIWLLGALPEEYGWRGYALGRLQSSFSPLVASLILGIIWSLWHLPLHFIPGTTQYVIPVWEYAAQTIVLTILYTWLFNHTGGSVMIAALFHTTGNLTGAYLPTWTTTLGRWLGLLPLLLIAIFIVTTGRLKKKTTTEVEIQGDFL